MGGSNRDASEAMGAVRAAPEATLDPAAVANAVDLVGTILALKANQRIISGMVRDGRESGMARAVRKHDTAAIYDWLMGLLSLQGISDQIAFGYIEKWGNATYAGLAQRLETTRCACPKLRDFASYTGCSYRKGKGTCANPQHLRLCPVRQLPLRKGLLNIQAVSLYHWLADVCGGDLVAMIDRVIAAAKASTEVDSDPVAGIRGDGGPPSPYAGAMEQVDRTDPPGAPGPPAWLQQAKSSLITSFSAVEGVSAKLANMSLAALMIGGRPKDSDWTAVATQMVTVDSLIHNHFERTGVLSALQAEHSYGPGCYGPEGCEAVIFKVTRLLQARSTGLKSASSDQRWPTPIDVQKALWRFCTAGVLDFCNAARVGLEPGCRAADGCPAAVHCAKAITCGWPDPADEQP